jgi:hypothetical protein
MLKDRIRDCKRTQERRVQSKFGITYDASIENVECTPAMLKEIIAFGHMVWCCTLSGT